MDKHLQKKRTSAYTSLESVNNMNNAREKTIQELRDELESLNKKLTEFEIILESIALDHEQVNRYMILTTKVECLLKESLDHINNKMHDRQTDQYKLDNENRRREEIIIEQKREKLEKENFQIRFGKLQTLSDLFKSSLEKKIAEKQILQKRISDIEAKNTNIIKISNKLALIEIDNDIILQLEKKVAVIKNLKEVFPGVYDRLSNLFKPIHSRYNVAVTKAFGIYMDSIVVDTQDTARKCIYFLKQYKLGREKFLPLDTIKSKFPNEKLRTELEDTNIKLLFDVLKISSTQINKAVLHVIADILVCETATEASKKAFESDCVSLDGCFFHKSGIISGGLTDLAKKAKLSTISVLKEQKEQLKQELKDLPNITRMQFDLDTINKDINQLIARNEVIEEDIKETKEKILTQDIKLNDLDKKLSSQDIIISGIRNNIQEKNKEIKIRERDNNKIKSKMFDDFCKENNLPDITYYENNLCLYKKQENKKLELLNLKANIENQLKFEDEFNRDSEFKDKVLKYTCVLKQAEKEYNKACEQERDMKIALDQEEIKISHLKVKHTELKKALQKAKDECIQYKAQINIITETYLEKKKIYLKIEQSIANKKNDCLTIIKECKVENINIPILSDSQDDLSTPSSYLSTESTLHEKQINIDFSKISKDFRNYNQIDLDHLEKIIQNCERNVTELQKKLQTLKKPNLKAHEKVDLIVQQLKDIAEKNKNLSTAFKNIETQFKLIKGKRHEQFSGCLECINAEIDSIYKNLVNDPSAQALVITENPEEPYMGGIIYSCLPPSKRFAQIQYLSDGEKSLATLALLFAMLRYKSPPFFIMDEGDAALDRVNVEKLVCFVGTEKNKIPFIMVTLNDNISSSADVAIGVTTNPNTECSQSRVFAVPLQ
ncbi:structural maintenance of chromosomes protein 1A-like isoform X2 [Nylanderia fulva]|uniref:structural maintenance of chromosomes protein 1A-like isoform X2 n=1 Tax=Nylanderia fulva TaxID=613905 RepID=UPI0010FB990C|nr:structural maintenance of chromosomes protein 1A-like isoform X2 [Nylanderia fulva]